MEEVKLCAYCGDPVQERNLTGICSRNPECKKQYKLAWYHNNPEKQNVWRRNHPDEVLLSNLKHRAKVKHFDFTLTAEDVPPVPDSCPCCKQPMVKAQGRAKHNSPSLDRIIPQLGYVPGNVQWLCRRCNLIKLDATPEEIMQVAIFVSGIRVT